MKKYYFVNKKENHMYTIEGNITNEISLMRGANWEHSCIPSENELKKYREISEEEAIGIIDEKTQILYNY